MQHSANLQGVGNLAMDEDIYFNHDYFDSGQNPQSDSYGQMMDLPSFGYPGGNGAKFDLSPRGLARLSGGSSGFLGSGGSGSDIWSLAGAGSGTQQPQQQHFSGSGISGISPMGSFVSPPAAALAHGLTTNPGVPALGDHPIHSTPSPGTDGEHRDSDPGPTCSGPVMVTLYHRTRTTKGWSCINANDEVRVTKDRGKVVKLRVECKCAFAKEDIDVELLDLKAVRQENTKDGIQVVSISMPQRVTLATGESATGVDLEVKLAKICKLLQFRVSINSGYCACVGTSVEFTTHNSGAKPPTASKSSPNSSSQRVQTSAATSPVGGAAASSPPPRPQFVPGVRAFPATPPPPPPAIKPQQQAAPVLAHQQFQQHQHQHQPHHPQPQPQPQQQQQHHTLQHAALHHSQSGFMSDPRPFPQGPSSQQHHQQHQQQQQQQQHSHHHPQHLQQQPYAYPQQLHQQPQALRSSGLAHSSSSLSSSSPQNGIPMVMMSDGAKKRKIEEAHQHQHQHQQLGSSGAMGPAASRQRGETFMINGGLDVEGIVRADAFLQYSDMRLKTEIEDIVDALSIISEIDGHRYRWKVDNPKFPERGGERAIGLIAQEVQRVLPEAVVEDEEGYLSVAYAELIPVLIAAFKQHLDNYQNDKEEFKKEFEVLRGEIKTKSNRLSTKAELGVLTRQMSALLATVNNHKSMQDIEKGEPLREEHERKKRRRRLLIGGGILLGLLLLAVLIIAIVVPVAVVAGGSSSGSSSTSSTTSTATTGSATGNANGNGKGKGAVRASRFLDEGGTGWSPSLPSDNRGGRSPNGEESHATSARLELRERGGGGVELPRYDER